MNEDFYNVEAVADKMGIAVKTVRAKINAGAIPAHKFEGRWYVLKSELIEAIKKGGKTV